MQHAALLRLLELVQRKLGARDARAEIGGLPPSEPHLLSASLPGKLRLVAIFDKPPEAREKLQTQLDELVASFAATVADELADDGTSHTPANLPRRRLDDALEALRVHVRARRVLIMDVQSPVLWGTSSRGDDNDVDELEELGRALARSQNRGIGIDELLSIEPEELPERLSHAGLLAAQVWSLERALQTARATDEPSEPLLLARAVFEVRAAHRAQPAERTVTRRGDLRLLARAFANIYRLVAIFDDEFSELHVESAMLQAIPTVEQLLFALPPVDPPPKAGRVMRLPARKS